MAPEAVSSQQALPAQGKEAATLAGSALLAGRANQLK